MISDYLYEFAIIVQEGSIAKAAPLLGLSQSSLTRHLSALETTLGAKLIDHSSNGLRLTEDGRYALDAASRITDLGVQLEQRFQDLHSTLPGQHGIMTSQQYDHQLLLGGISDSRALHSVLGEVREGLAAAGVDINLLFMQPRTPVSFESSLIEHDCDIILAYRGSFEYGYQAEEDATNRSGLDPLESVSDTVIHCFSLFDAPGAVVVTKNHPFSARSAVMLAELQDCLLGRIAGAVNNTGAMWDEFVRACNKRGFAPWSYTIGYESMPDFNQLGPDIVMPCSLDDPCIDVFKADTNIVVNVPDLRFEVVALTRADDAIAERFVLEMHALLGTTDSDITQV